MSLNANFQNALKGYHDLWIKGSFDYQTRDNQEELVTFENFLSFLHRPAFFSHEMIPGHVTCSALVINKQATKVLLLHHKKLERWLQLGGHVEESDLSLSQAALREAREESGIAELSFARLPGEGTPFDLDIHRIPANKTQASHLHYDVRYLIQTDENNSIIENKQESNCVRWFSFAEALQLTEERSIHRQLYKALTCVKKEREMV